MEIFNRTEIVIIGVVHEIYKKEVLEYIEEYNKQFYNMLNGTQYEEYAQFWKDRDRHIADNIINIIEGNKGGRIVFIMGGDHKYFAIREIEKHFGDDIKLIKSLE